MANVDIDWPPRTLFKRCVQCPSASPACPSCPSGQTCSLSIQSCNSCASTSCVAVTTVNPSSSPPSSHSSSSTAGAIAGGVIGGIIAIVAIVFLIWRFCIKKRRQEFDDHEWVDEKEQGTEQFSLQRDARASTHTVGSIASTIYTRASNVIPIAYIPGVTNRSIESSPDLVPPVPPIPAASISTSTTSSPHIPGHDQHFFMPSDLRDSTYSGYTDRSSVATTIYRHNAIVDPIPAQTVMRGKAVPVSVKSSGKSSPTTPSRSSTPPLPTTNYPREGQGPLNTKSSIIGRMATPRTVTVTRTPSNTAPVSGPEFSESERPESPLMKAPIPRTASASPQYSNDSSTFDDASSEEDEESVRARQSLMAHNRHSNATTVIQDSPASPHATGPFRTTPSTSARGGAARDGRGHKHKKSTSLNQIIEEATRRATREPRHGGLGSYKRAQGPFSDIHIARTP